MVRDARLDTANEHEAPAPHDLPLEIVHPKPDSEDQINATRAKYRVELVARSSRGRIVEFEPTDHEVLIKPDPVLDSMVSRIVDLSQASAQTSLASARYVRSGRRS